MVLIHHYYRAKIKRSKILLAALYRGWLVRRCLQEETILNQIMEIQDTNAYIEELEYMQDHEQLLVVKQQRKQTVSDFIDTLNQVLDFQDKVDSEIQTRRMSVVDWSKQLQKQVSLF